MRPAAKKDATLGHLQESLVADNIGDIVKTSQAESGIEAVNYAEMVNRSENGTSLAKASYH